MMFSVPLRRALVTGSDLPYPEGKAAAEVLIVGSSEGAGSEDNKKGLGLMVMTALASAAMSLLAAMKLVAAEIAQFFKIGAGVTGFTSSLGLAFIGVGHLVGLSVGIAMALGVAISWVWLVPYYSQGIAGEDLAAIATDVFRNKARIIGAGAMGVAAIWTLLKIIGPIVQGLKGALAASAARADGGELALTERDLPIKQVAGISIAMLFPIAFARAANSGS